MKNDFTVITSGMQVLGKEQARFFALSIYADVKTYITAHITELDAWQKAGAPDEY